MRVGCNHAPGDVGTTSATPAIPSRGRLRSQSQGIETDDLLSRVPRRVEKCLAEVTGATTGMGQFRGALSAPRGPRGLVLRQ